MGKLYEIAQNIKQLEELLEQMDEGDATKESVQVYLDSLVDVDFSQKVENIVKFIKNLEAEAEMFKSEKKRLEALEKSANKKAESLKNYLTVTLQSLGYNHKNKKKVETSIGKIGFRKTQAVLEITDMDKIPSEWDKPLQREVKKAELLKYAKELVGDLKDKDEVELEELGIKIVNNNSSLQIK